jgi:hypothetical protein
MGMMKVWAIFFWSFFFHHHMIVQQQQEQELDALKIAFKEEWVFHPMLFKA